MENKETNKETSTSNKENKSKTHGSIKNQNQNNKSKQKFNIYWIYAIIIGVFLAISFFNSTNSAVQINWSRFSNMLKDSDVEKITIINNEKADIYIKKEKLENDAEKYPEYQHSNKRTSPLGVKAQYFFYIGDEEVFRSDLDKAQAQLPIENRILPNHNIEKNYMGDFLNWGFFILILVLFWVFIFRRMGGGGGSMGGGPGGIFNVGKSKAALFDKESSIKLNFNDVAGLAEAKEEVMEIVDFLKNSNKYTRLGGEIPKGALLIGPPGTGKTLLAKAVAGESNVPFFSMSGSDFVEMFVGVGASRVRDLFKQAKDKAPCIIFIDEIDAVGRARGKNANFGGNDERENTLNQLLTEMDGFASNAGVIILAATNRADILDRALLRAGRFDRQIHVELPDINEREAIFNVHLKPIKIEKKIDSLFLGKQTPGFSGADIANVCNEAALIAARKNKKTVQKQDFLDAIDRIVGGLEKKNKIISFKEKKTIAFHEAGHATISWILEHANPLIKVTIIPRGKALGAAWYLPEERQITTTEQMLDELCSALGGRASEDINFGKISTGALNDLEKTTKQAYAMVSYFGMNDEIGNISYYDSSGQNEYSFSKPYSDNTADLIDKEVKKMIQEQYERAKNVLTEHKEGLTKLANLLLEKEVIFSEDLENIFGKRKINEQELAEEKNQIKKRTVKPKTVTKTKKPIVKVKKVVPKNKTTKKS